MSGDEWRTPNFRQSVVVKIDEAIQRSGMATVKKGIEMENHVFQKAKNKEEYLGFVARLILHVREMNSKKGGPMGGNAVNNMQDPINALQNLARQGTGNQMMGGVLPPPVPQQNNPAMMQGMNARPVLQQKLQPTVQTGVMMGTLGNTMGGTQMGGPQMAGTQLGGPTMGTSQIGAPQMANTQIGPAQMGGPQMAAQMGGPQMGGPQMGGAQMGGPQMAGGQMGVGMAGGSPLSAGMSPHMQQRKPDGTPMMGQAPGSFVGPRGVAPGQYLRQSPTPPTASPVQPPTMPTGNQMVPSPALVPSPGNPQLCGPQMRQVGMASSPSSSCLNTPGQPGASPCNLQEDAAYRDKIRQLSKYIEPLRRMIARVGSEGNVLRGSYLLARDSVVPRDVFLEGRTGFGHSSNFSDMQASEARKTSRGTTESLANLEKLSKMKTLLDILTNPNKRMPLETLLKCEVVLEKVDLKRGDIVQPAREQHPLIEALRSHLQSPVINHTLQRTFGPCIEALFGSDIRNVPPPLKRRKVEEPSDDIPEVLQGEIARLDQRFKVSLDPMGNSGVGGGVQLVCWLDDKNLPCVPPVCVWVPEDYPASRPKCQLASHDHCATSFLTALSTALALRVARLPPHYTVSQLLDTWEMSVRQACSGSNTVTQATNAIAAAVATPVLVDL